MSFDLTSLQKQISSTETKDQGSLANKLLSKQIVVFKHRFNDDKKEKFYTELSLLLEAGLDIKTSLEMISNTVKNPKDKSIIEGIKIDLISGKTLSHSLEKSEYFSLYEIYSLKIGEESGKIVIVLNELSQYFEKKIKLKRQSIQALAYPFLVLLTAFCTIAFMLGFVVPMFEQVFKRFNTELPYLTKLILRLSELTPIILLFLFLLSASSFISFFQLKKNIAFRKFTSSLVLRVPVLGQLIKKVYLARFCQSMSLLLNAKTPLIQSVELVSKMVGFFPIEIALKSVAVDLEKGIPFNACLKKHSVFDDRIISLVKVAEETNKTDLVFTKLASQYSVEVETKSATIGVVVEPVLLIVLGGIVALILIAMYLPMFKLSTSVGY
ncbi:MAG TPA: type II secretion system F family protein [Bacteroidia bacterium]|nr:type II secretion system F family protein [Bacteroidia bacterium]HNU34418.1 type II secretion system F family protein [Bacteroidia bacterium]